MKEFFREMYREQDNRVGFGDRGQVSVENEMNRELRSYATFSPCRQYRYTLWRVWGQDDMYVNFICLNPSTADETKDDNTIRKCVKFAKSWGYDGLCVTNIFAWRSTDPEAMKAVAAQGIDPVGAENDLYLEQIAANAKLVVAAWSQHGSFLNRSTRVRSLLNVPLQILRLGKGKYPEPWHPLYLPDNTRPIPWNSFAPTVSTETTRSTRNGR